MDIIFGTDIWSLLLVLLTQDMPFLVARILILTHFRLAKNYMIYFLTIKNFLVCILGVYEMAVSVVEAMEKRKNKVSITIIEKSLSLRKATDLLEK